MRFLHELSWSELDPRTLRFDSELLRRRIVEVLEANRPGTGRDAEHRKIKGEQAVTELIATEFGAWSIGWRTGDSGIVESWCCRKHSFFPTGNSDEELQATADRIFQAIGEWQSYLDRLAAIFESAVVPDDVEQARLALAAATGRVVTEVVRSTECHDAWNWFAEMALSWMLESHGVPKSDASEAAKQALEGRFMSWTEPEDEVTQQAAAELAALAVAKIEH